MVAGQHFSKNESIFKKAVVLTLGFFTFVISNGQAEHNGNAIDSNESISSSEGEKLYIHTDVNEYYSGGTIWFKIYLIDGATHTLDGVSEVVYVELLNAEDKQVDVKVVHCKKGLGQGDFHLSEKLENGTYRLRGYTQYMKNFGAGQFFEKYIAIGSSASDEKIDSDSNATANSNASNDTFSVKFYPEGGSLLNEYLNKIAFFIRNGNGDGVAAQGKLLNETNELVLEFSSSESGLGFFEFVPKKDKKYRAILVGNGVEKTLDFPQSLDKGIKMTIVEFEDHYRANIESNAVGSLGGFTFEGRQRNGTVFTSQVQGKESNLVIKVPKNTLEEGIAQFRLFDKNGVLKSRRKVFYEALRSSPKITISADSEYEIGKPMALELFLNADGEASKANVSISITRETLEDPIKRQTSIRSYFLMESEIPRSSRVINGLLDSSGIMRRKNLDILVMTHKWKDSLILEEGKDPLKTPKFEPERGFALSGTIKDVVGEAQEGATVFLNYKGSNEIGLEEVKTDSLGRFAFRDLYFMDSTLVSLVASKPFPKGKDKQKTAKEIGVELTIALDSIANWVFQNQIESSKDIGFSMVPLAKLNQDNSKRLYPNEDEQSRLVVLDEVAASSDKLEKETRYQKRRMLYKNPSQTLDFENMPSLPASSPLEALVGRVPGLSIRNGRIFMRGASSFRIEESAALVLLNGMPMGSSVGVEQIPVSEIDFIDVLKGPKAAIYGSRGANGVVAVYTKIGPKTTKKTKKDFPMGSLSFVHPGFNASREFVGEMPKTENGTYTLFWNPSLFLETNGTSLELDAPKVPGMYKITVEGMCFDGRPLSQVQYFEVR